MTGRSPRRKGRGWLNSIDRLPIECADDVYWLRTELAARGRTQETLRNEFNARVADKGYGAISKGAFSRFAIRHAESDANRNIRRVVLDAQRELLADAGFAAPRAAHDMARAIGGTVCSTAITDGGFADRAAAHEIARKRAKSGVQVFRGIFGACEIGHQHLDADGREVPATVLQALHLAAGDVRRSIENERVRAGGSEDVGHEELLQRVNVLLHLIQALFDRLGQGANPPLVAD